MPASATVPIFSFSVFLCYLQLFTLYRFGVGDFDWKEFTSRMKQKTYEEIKE